MSDVRVIVNGALGKMGQAVSAGLHQTAGLSVVAGVDVAAQGIRMSIPPAGLDVPLSTQVEDALDITTADVLVDFSTARATRVAVTVAATRGVNFVVGTTGLDDDTIAAMRSLASDHGVGGVVAPNFAMGAVLLIHLAEKAAPFFEYAEIIETHHETKIDAPSGTAAMTAHLMVNARGGPFKRNLPEKELVPGTRGGEIDGVTVHSLRLPGAMAHQEVIFGIDGQTLSLRHDTINRDCYVPGIAMAVRHAATHKGLVEGLDTLMGL